MSKLSGFLSCAVALALASCSDDAADRWCDRGGGPSEDIVVGGGIVAKVCYGPSENNPDARVVDGNEVPAPTANDTVLVFAPATDGTPIPGNVTVSGDSVTIYGNGAANTLLQGNVTITGSGARLRGVTITGNLFVRSANAAIVDCVVRGNLEINADDTLLAGSTVYGNVIGTSNENVFVENRVQGQWSIGGVNPRCEANVAFADADDDFVVDGGEVTALLTCP